MRVFLFSLIVLSFIANSWVNSQEIQEDRKFWEEKLQELYGQIYDLKQQAQTDNSPELKEEINRLIQEAEKIEKKIQEQIEKAQSQKQPDRRADKKELPDKKDIEKQIQFKKKQLKALQKEIEQCDDEEEREYLELYRQKLLEDLSRFQKEPKPEQRQKFQRQEFMFKMKRNQDQEGEPRFPQKGNEIEGRLREFLKFLQKENLQEFQNLMQLRDKDFDLFREHLKELFKNFREKRQPKHQDPETQKVLDEVKKLEKQAEEESKKLQGLSVEEKEKKIQEIKTLLGQIFDAKNSIREKELFQMQKEWEKHKEQLEKRRKNKDLIIERRLKEILGEEGEWDW